MRRISAIAIVGALLLVGLSAAPVAALASRPADTFSLAAQWQPGIPQATVTAYFLNVRSAPNPFTGAVLTIISRGQTFPVVGRNADFSWLQLNVNGIIGWVNSAYVAAQNIAGVPITDSSSGVIPQPPAGITATVTAYFLNVRNAPNPFIGAVLTRISNGQTFPVVGRNADASWLQLNVNGLIGWVNSRYVFAPNAALAPITDPSTNPVPPQATATVTAHFLNVRSGPGPTFPILTIISRGQSFPAVGRNAAGTWVQLNVGGTIGWVNRSWVALSNLWNLPITG
ncbi:MAG: SH3 domain-containing protein [Aggregatilineales bacterium]